MTSTEHNLQQANPELASEAMQNALDELIEKALNDHQAGKLDEAKTGYENVLKEFPEHHLVVHLLGMVHQQNGQLKEALPLFNKAIEMDPENPTYHYNMGLLQVDLSSPQQAIAFFETALRISPEYVEAWDGLARTAEILKQPVKAKAAYEKLLQLDPTNDQWHQGCALVMEEMGQLNEALVHWIDAAMKNPTNVEACFRVARHQYDTGQLDEAINMLRHVLKLDPEHTQASLYLAQTLAGLGEAEEAKSLFQTVFLRSFVPGIRIRRLFTLPIMYDNKNSVEQWRKSFTQEVSELKGQFLRIENPVSEIGMIPFYLVYQGENDKALMSDIAEMLERNIAARPGTPQVADIAIGKAPNAKPKIAVVSRYLHQNHTIQRVFGKLIGSLDREKFDVVECPILDFAQKTVPTAIHPENTVLPLSISDYWGACDALKKEAPDLILYTDIGMEPMSYFLALHRLAPKQCVTWGHPVTTGMPNIDYYLSNRWMESGPEAQEHYREKLVLLDEIPAYFDKVQLTGSTPTKSEFGLDESLHYYVCPQTQYKLHPEFDETVRQILERDPQGRFVIFTGSFQNWNDRLLARLKTSLGESLVDRVQILPFMNREKFIRFLAVADVVLDTPKFGGGCTTLDTLSVGTPVVTLEGPLMRQRMTAGLLKRIDVTETVTDSVEAYVNCAVEIANNPEKRAQLKEKILVNHGPLFNNPAAVTALEDFFTQELKPALGPESV